MLCSLSLSYHRTPLRLGKLFLLKRTVFSKCLSLKLGHFAQGSVRLASGCKNRPQRGFKSQPQSTSIHYPRPGPCCKSFAFGTHPLGPFRAPWPDRAFHLIVPEIRSTLKGRVPKEITGSNSDNGRQQHANSRTGGIREVSEVSEVSARGLLSGKSLE